MLEADSLFVAKSIRCCFFVVLFSNVTCRTGTHFTETCVRTEKLNFIERATTTQKELTATKCKQ